MKSSYTCRHIFYIQPSAYDAGFRAPVFWNWVCKLKFCIYRFCCCVIAWICMYVYIYIYPISTLPEHLHSTFPSHAKLPENTLTEKKNIPFPSLTLITCLTGPPVTPPPFTGRPSHTLSYTTILFLALKVNGRFLESLPVVTFASLELKLPVFLFINFY